MAVSCVVDEKCHQRNFGCDMNTTSISIIDFDDLSTPRRDSSPVPTLYRGLIWKKIYYLDKNNFWVQPSGYELHRGSDPYVAYFQGTKASIAHSVVGDTFTLVSFKASPAWNINLNLEMKGYLNGNLVVAANEVLTSPIVTQDILLTGFVNLDKVEFKTSGGTKYPPLSRGGGTQAVIDDIRIIL